MPIYYLVLAVLAATYALLWVVLHAPFGHALRGIRGNEHRMRSLGFATPRYKLLAFVIAGALAGLAGYLDAAQFGVVNPELFGWRLSGSVLMMVILGGMGTLDGADARRRACWCCSRIFSAISPRIGCCRWACSSSPPCCCCRRD